MPTGAINDLNSLLNRTDNNGVVNATTERSRLKKATQEFEAVFVGLMLKQMRKSMASSNSIFGNNSESKMYQDMTDDATAEQISKTGSFGLAKKLYASLERSLHLGPENDKNAQAKP